MSSRALIIQKHAQTDERFVDFLEEKDLEKTQAENQDQDIRRFVNNELNRKWDE